MGVVLFQIVSDRAVLAMMKSTDVALLATVQSSKSRTNSLRGKQPHQSMHRASAPFASFQCSHSLDISCGAALYSGIHHPSNANFVFAGVHAWLAWIVQHTSASAATDGEREGDAERKV